MASTYGLHFGFRRSDEAYRVSEGRVRTPKLSAANPNPLLIGTCVQLVQGTDGAAAGYVEPAKAGATARTGVCGILLQEEDHLRSIYQLDSADSFGTGVAKPDTLSVITNGPGTKVWFKNIPGTTRTDGRVTPEVTIVDTTNLQAGDLLGWNGTVWAAAAGEADAHFVVTEVKDGYVEAVCTK